LQKQKQQQTKLNRKEDGVMSKQNQIKHVRAGTGAAYNGPGDQATFLVTGAESGGSYFISEFKCPPGGGPPPHIHHREEESYYILQGEATVQADGRTFHASVGDFIHIPRGTVHCFKNDGKVDLKMVITFSPTGMEKFFEESFYPAVDRSASPPLVTDELMRRMQAAAQKNGMEFVNPA
jgi:mannose-6-phosphate isomerase-like protein (cupin superfamily)